MLRGCPEVQEVKSLEVPRLERYLADDWGKHGRVQQSSIPAAISSFGYSPRCDLRKLRPWRSGPDWKINSRQRMTVPSKMVNAQG